MHRGWYQLTFTEALEDGLHPAWIGARALMIRRQGTRFDVFEAYCPHRGAHLCAGGTLDGDAVICPFHGLRIALGAGEGDFRLEPFPSFEVGGLLFVRERDGPDCGFENFMRELAETHFLIPGFVLEIATTPELVIENAFDQTHFRPVHGLANVPQLELRESRFGEFSASGRFRIPPSRWQRSAADGELLEVPFTATAFSPTIVVSHLGGDHPYRVLTAALPVEGGCRVHLSLALPRETTDQWGLREGARYLLTQARDGLEKDRVIWENMAPDPPFRPLASDRLVLALREFARGFAGGGG